MRQQKFLIPFQIQMLQQWISRSSVSISYKSFDFRHYSIRSFSRSVFQAKFFFNPQRMKIYLSLESLDKIRSKMLDIKEQLVKQKQDLQQKKQDSGTPTNSKTMVFTCV